ncbi:MAG: glycosyltransferase family 2 protein [Clostridia bacterium]|nr:glycosyltransferase family 2 protein [Clostridia bacterium]
MIFSVIVPVYNVEKYLGECVESVLAQTFPDFELILVDDGSTDTCPAICDNYQSQDSRIRVIHQENKGLAGARQTGIRHAAGKFVLNLDSDDMIEPDTLACAYRILIESNPDIISFAYRWVRENITIAITDDGLPEGIYEGEKLKKHIFPKLLSDSSMEHMSYYLSGKVIKRELLLPHQLAVNPKISLGEDLCCVFPCYLEAKKVYVSSKITYFYRVRTDSMSKKFNTAQVEKVWQILEHLTNLNIAKPSDFSMQLCRYYFFMCFAILAAAAEGNHFECIGELTEKIVAHKNFSYLKQAHFSHLTAKTRIGLYLIRKKQIRVLFYFLNICKRLKSIVKRG